MNSMFTCSKYRHGNLPDGKMHFMFHKGYSLTPDQLRNIFIWLSGRTGSHNIYILFKVCICVKLGYFLSKMCKVSFLFSMYFREKVNGHDSLMAYR